MMDEIHRILKPKGKVFIAGPSQKSYIFCSPEHVEAYINLVNTDSQFKTHGLSSDEFMEIFSDFKILRHKSDHFFFRWILDNPCISQMNFDAVEKLYSEFCSVIGKALDADPDAKWYNYIQMFTLSK
jgi:predicted SAM-dependent methyltransferase